ncbi:MAG: hypothetical protein ABI383_12945 [Acidobacteriaceae bacterium]
MILIALSMKQESAAAAIQTASEMEVRCGQSLQDLLGPLKRGELTAFVVDPRLLEADAATADLVWRYAGAALPVIVDPGVQSPRQIACALMSAMERRERDRSHAREAERLALSAALADPLTGLLVNVAVVLEDKKLARVTRIRLERVQRIAESMRVFTTQKRKELSRRPVAKTNTASGVK